MGLMLSVLVFCVGVLEALSCIEHIRNSYLPFELHKKRKRRLVVDLNTGKARHCMVDAVWPGDVPRNQHIIRKRSGYTSLPNSIDITEDEGDANIISVIQEMGTSSSSVGLPSFTPEDLQHALSSALFERDEELIEEEDEEVVDETGNDAVPSSDEVLQQDLDIEAGVGETPSNETSTGSEELTEIFKPSPVHSPAELAVNNNDQTDVEEDEEELEYLDRGDKHLLIKDKQMGPLDLEFSSSSNNNNANDIIKEAVMTNEDNLIKSADDGILKIELENKSTKIDEKTKNEIHPLEKGENLKPILENLEKTDSEKSKIIGESIETKSEVTAAAVTSAADKANSEKKISTDTVNISKKTVHIQLKEEDASTTVTTKISSTDRPLSVETFALSDVMLEKNQKIDETEEAEEKVQKKPEENLDDIRCNDEKLLGKQDGAIPFDQDDDTSGMENNEFQQMIDNKQDIDSLKKVIKRKPKRKQHRISQGRVQSIEESDTEVGGKQQQRKIIDIELVECKLSTTQTSGKQTDSGNSQHQTLETTGGNADRTAASVKHNLVKMKSSFDDEHDEEDVDKKKKSQTISVKPSEPMVKPQMEPMDDPTSPDKAFWLIFSGEYTKAMSKDWHSGHFCCWQCDESLTGQRYVLRDDHPYCIKCYESVFANTCDECNKTIGIDSKDLSYKDKHWHEACFFCNKCKVSLVDKQFGSKADKIYCGNCYDAQFASRCDGCGQIFRAGTKKMEYKTRQWHEQCFCCCVCKTPIGTKSFIPREQEIYCATCYEEKFATRCVKCNKIITSGGVTYKNEPWHRECFTCTNCNTSLAGQRFTSREEKPYCADCFGELFAKRCTACCKPITGIGGTRFISFEDRHWHNDCFICASCKSSLVGRGFITDAEDILCTECAKQKLM